MLSPRYCFSIPIHDFANYTADYSMPSIHGFGKETGWLQCIRQAALFKILPGYFYSIVNLFILNLIHYSSIIIVIIMQQICAMIRNKIPSFNIFWFLLDLDFFQMTRLIYHGTGNTFLTKTISWESNCKENFDNDIWIKSFWSAFLKPLRPVSLMTMML